MPYSKYLSALSDLRPIIIYSIESVNLEMNNQRTFSQTGVHEECGVFGIYDLDHQNVAPSIYYGLCALQHRGQESCGIALTDTTGPKGNIQVHKGLGL